MSTSLTDNTLTLNNVTLTAPEYDGVIATTGDYCYKSFSSLDQTAVAIGPNGNAPQVGSTFVGVQSNRGSGASTVTFVGSWWLGQVYGVSNVYAGIYSGASARLGACSLTVGVRLS